MLMAFLIRQTLNPLRTIRVSSVLCNRSFRMSANLRAEEALEELKQKNPYFDKYAAKISALQKKSPEEFLNRLDSANQQTNSKQPKEKQRDYSELLNPKPKLRTTPSDAVHKKLEDIVKIDMLQEKTADEIKNIWLKYHEKKDVLVATIPKNVYEVLEKRSSEHPIFLVPLPRSQGFEFFMLQFAGNTVHFTPLLCYQAHKENAPECLNIAHYTEFKEKLGIVLMRAEYDKNVINAQEAQCLINQLQMYYSQNIQTKLDLLKRFTHEPDNFKHMDIINELENLSIK